MMALSEERIRQLVCQPKCLLRIAEIIMAIICLSLVRTYLLMGGQIDWFLISFFTPASSLLITPALVLHQLVEDPLKPPLSELLLDFLTSVLYLASGSCSVKYYSTFYTLPKYKTAGMAYGVLSILTGILYLCTCLLSRQESIMSTAKNVRVFANNLGRRVTNVRA